MERSTAVIPKKKERPIQRWLRLFLCGLCMGAADIVPGISGGTIAFIMGFYSGLLNSIKSIDMRAMRDLLCFRFNAFHQRVHVDFLLPLGIGIIFSFMGLAQLIQFLLADPTYRELLYSAFLGLICASTWFCIRQIVRWKFFHFLALTIGTMVAYLLTNQELFATAIMDINPEIVSEKDLWINGFLICCGAVAVSAMLLPGISGSYLLTILGVYAPAISAVADFSHGLQHGHFEGTAFLFLSNIFVGIVIGGILFTRIISFLLRRYEQVTIALMIGFMIGALRSVWPFWSYSYIIDPMHAERGAVLHVNQPILPNVTTPLFAMSLICIILGFTLVVFLSLYSSRKMSKKG